MKFFPFRKKRYLLILPVIIVAAAVLLLGDPWGLFTALTRFLDDREQVRTFVLSYGSAAPLVFMGIQVLQVILAPIPGEVSGFIGGFVFGTARGFLYSSVALAAGSWINFTIGRLLGREAVKRLIPPRQLVRFDAMLRHQGTVILFLLFVFPGFPKDFLCLFLGLSSLSHRVFLLIAGIGRMPGTFMLSLQGAALYEDNLVMFAVLTAVFAFMALAAWYYRERLYRLLDRLNADHPDRPVDPRV
jgi:uncharacterized membrane protein YdjX (TVP38/TMEM64 family)